MFRKTFSWLLLIIAFLSLVHHVEGKIKSFYTCKSDRDCPPNFYCLNHVCTLRSAPRPSGPKFPYGPWG
ncbi:unnamed protein product [Caenorhabditis auriculariae]|uniref:Nodule Cysteine-Rich (NCR) secreted peptide n=1 Tax=Caenorhabditis auriculariae TaxID=2777116 RepID=A0A8S1H2D4_9PELO|nr:unnamed protein product [Caenorhabditis auriculariae]